MTKLEQASYKIVIISAIILVFVTLIVTREQAKDVEILSAEVTKLSDYVETEKSKQPDAIRITSENKEDFVKRNMSPVERIKFPDMSELKRDDFVMYDSGKLAKVTDIAQMDDCWVVKTTKGEGIYARWGTEINGGERIKGILPGNVNGGKP